MIYDGHCHVASTDFIPDAFLGDVACGMRRRLDVVAAGPPLDRLHESYRAQHRDHDADRLVAEMDAAGVARSVLMVPDFGFVMPGQPDLAAMARRHHEIRLRHPGRFWVYLGADPRRGEAGASEFADLVDRYAFDGLKLYPPCGYSPSDRSLYPYYEVCRSRSLPVFVHTGPTAQSLTFTTSEAILVDRAARDFPEVPFVLGHGGVTDVEVSAYLAAYRPNVFVDTGGFAGSPVAGGWPAHLNRLFRLGVNHKIIFGTDWPLNQLSGGLQRLVGEVRDGDEVFAGVSRRDRDLVLRENLLRVLSPASVDRADRPPAERRHG
ncbi:amidohydrolase family protein [Micromonospora sp. R77]|uniref:amidohydrolase family protein n=1 Tax=Micromonospora sp. R77 TaxID=2925836 RepID=UPI001F624AAF|nr:amidohydrolase family protein [Micromonospora sp. R77]MCI4066848.1 amidohydrolase family protein [Micromonospora sp. R77]